MARIGVTFVGPNEEWIHSDGSAGGEYSPDIDVMGLMLA